MLKIQNINRIVGQHLYSKWLPKTEGWAVRAVEAVGDTYIFELINTQSGSWRQAEIQLRRERKIDPNDFIAKWELWAWNLENNKPEVKWNKLKDLETVKDGVLWVGYVLDKIIPSK